MFTTDKPFLTYYYHNDYLNSVRLVTNESGHQVSGMDYFPYGVMRKHWSGESDFQYTGVRSNWVDDSYDNQYRQYYPFIGSIRQIDPLAYLKPSFSPYVYASNNPLRYTEPTGLSEAELITKVIKMGNKIVTVSGNAEDFNNFKNAMAQNGGSVLESPFPSMGEMVNSGIDQAVLRDLYKSANQAHADGFIDAVGVGGSIGMDIISATFPVVGIASNGNKILNWLSNLFGGDDSSNNGQENDSSSDNGGEDNGEDQE